MRKNFVLVGLALGLTLIAQNATARLSYDVHSLKDGSKFIMVNGQFEADDDLTIFRNKVLSSHAFSVSFFSGGGNVYKAMEFGRLIRSLGLQTVAARGSECASACSLAFLGGVTRYAEPDAIGVHKSSFGDTRGMNVEDAVAAVQQQTGDVISYMSEMGVDPSLLQLSLKYDSNDMRYLTSSEMTQFRVTTVSFQEVHESEAKSSSGKAQAPIADGRKASKTLNEGLPLLQIPAPRSGIVQDDSGSAQLKTSRDMRAKTIATFANGSKLQIAKSIGDWYRVSIGKKSGYMRQASVWVREFEERQLGRRYIEITTEKFLEPAMSFAKRSFIPMAVHLTVQGSYAVTIVGTYEGDVDSLVFQPLIKTKSIPPTAFVTYGNNYVREICCSASTATAK
ncbi:hypothetical protein CCGE531_06570 [Rhizobium sp. CCGE531]|nr:hypothetical protein CCGE531_06570 [Rhizobium sp. CCGE531]AYG72175.1 hypothetical protein CCGE532_06570 [Rhizobium sp. CCGE532]